MIYRKDIQILRGVAVFLVILYHLKIPFFSNGFLGVDVFFVISGFLMAKLYDQGTITDFYKRRVYRLLPAYAITVILVAGVSSFILVPTDFSQLYEQAVASIFFVNNIHFWNQNSYFDSVAFNPLLNLWSLSVEAQFYLIVPFLYPIFRRRKNLFIAIIFLSFLVCIVMQTISPKTAFFLMPFRIWEFLFGAWVTWNSSDHKPYATRNQLIVLITLSVSLFLLPINPEGQSIFTGHPSLIALWVVFLTAAIIYYGIPKFVENSFIGLILEKVGNYSYSLYLVHFPIIILFNYQAFGGTILGATNIIQIFWIGIIGLISAFLLYQYIEKKRATYFKSINISIGCLLMIFVSANAASFINESNYSENERNIFAAWKDRGVYRCGKLFRILHPTEKTCNISSVEKERRIFLIGESHADSIKDEFDKVAKQYDASVYFTVDNNPLMHPKFDANTALSEIRKHKINAVLIHYSSDFYKNDDHLKQLIKFIDLSLAENISVSLIEPVPTYRTHIPRSIFLQTRETNKSENFYIDRTQHYKNIEVFENFLHSSLKKRNVSIYQPAKILCPEESNCFVADSKLRPFYFDQAHLTLTGSSVLSPMFHQILKSLSSDDFKSENAPTKEIFKPNGPVD